MLPESFLWSPGIGDPTALGWLTVAAYFAVAWICRRTSHQPPPRSTDDSARRLHWYWVLFALILCGLGINKQLDLQSLFTEVGRNIAIAQGWYGDRRSIQALFLVVVAVASLAATGLILAWLWPFRRFIVIPSLGMGVLGAFVLIRAASFHHVDRLISSDLLGIRFNAILELGGIVTIGWGARRYAALMRSKAALTASQPRSPTGKRVVLEPR